jgi:AraC family transcriptional regulator
MEWIERMNAVIDYMENHLEEDISKNEVSRIAACPYNVFQRSFVQVSGITLTEYLRRRRLTAAAADLQKDREKVIDIALRYGYESPDAFRVAFKRLHGIGPNEARRKNAQLKFFSRMQFTLAIQGIQEMEFRNIEKDAFNVAGIRRTTTQGGGTWAIVKADGSLKKMEQAAGKEFVSLGLCFGFDDEGNNDYMCGYQCRGEIPPEFENYACPKSHWLVFEARGTISANVLGNTWKRIYSEFLPHSQYQQIDLPTIERYLEWDINTDNCRVEIMIPVEG